MLVVFKRIGALELTYMLECFGVIVGCVSFDICVLYVCDNVPKILEN